MMKNNGLVAKDSKGSASIETNWLRTLSPFIQKAIYFINVYLLQIRSPYQFAYAPFFFDRQRREGYDAMFVLKRQANLATSS